MPDAAQPEGHVSCPANLKPGANTYALRVKGDCMSPDYVTGDSVIVDPDRGPKYDDFVVVWDKDGGAVMGKLALAPPPKSIWSLTEGNALAALLIEEQNPPHQYLIHTHEVAALHVIISKAVK